MSAFGWVFLGGGIGSTCRYAISRMFPPASGFPWGTFLANSLACLILGLAVAYLSRANLPPSVRPFLLTGFCGGFSTFSTFSMELVQLLRAGQGLMAMVYAVSSLAVGMGVLFLSLSLLGNE